MASHHSNVYYSGYYPGSEEGAVSGVNGSGDYQPPNPTDINANLQVPHHAMHSENGFHSSWNNYMFINQQIYNNTRPPSQDAAMYNGHGHYLQYSPEGGPAVPSSVNVPSMIAPQPSHTPSPSALTNGHDHHSPTYYGTYPVAMPGAVESVGCPPETDTPNHNVSNDSANMAMQALTLNPLRVASEENGTHDGRSAVDWTMRRYHSAEPQTGAVDGVAGAEAVEIKQETIDQPWRANDLLPRNNSRSNNSCGEEGQMATNITPPKNWSKFESGSGASPLREEHEARENNWKAAGKTRTKDKYRVVYSDHQRLELEREFYLSRYITIRRKTELASQLCLSERQVKIWFQNQRAKQVKWLLKNGHITSKKELGGSYTHCSTDPSTNPIIQMYHQKYVDTMIQPKNVNIPTVQTVQRSHPYANSRSLTATRRLHRDQRVHSPPDQPMCVPNQQLSLQNLLGMQSTDSISPNLPVDETSIPIKVANQIFYPITQRVYSSPDPPMHFPSPPLSSQNVLRRQSTEAIGPNLSMDDTSSQIMAANQTLHPMNQRVYSPPDQFMHVPSPPLSSQNVLGMSSTGSISPNLPVDEISIPIRADNQIIYYGQSHSHQQHAHDNHGYHNLHTPATGRVRGVRDRKGTE